MSKTKKHVLVCSYILCKSIHHIKNELCSCNEFIMEKKKEEVDERSKDVSGLFVPQSGLQGRWVEPLASADELLEPWRRCRRGRF
jgi:hypothetical protein